MAEEKQVSIENLENMVDFLDRLKYVAVPMALTVGAYFTPELKEKYNGLPQETRDKYRTIMLTSAVIVGSIMTASSGYTLFKDYQKKKGKNISETVQVE
jgi:hypothetical protein